jgi:hypothetical protein
MTPRVFLNLVYARLMETAERAEDPGKAREEIIGELYAPLDKRDDITSLIAGLEG